MDTIAALAKVILGLAISFFTTVRAALAAKREEAKHDDG